jgi:pSer/pThr/pTyr-binding forkhead associated (FHA) protein
MSAQLVALADGLRIALEKPIVLMGRDAECDIQFESRKISRRHCCIAQVGNYLVIRDLGSTNGVRINGVRVVEGYLHSGDEVAIGNDRFQVLMSQPGAVESEGQRSKPAPNNGASAAVEPILLDDANRPVKGSKEPSEPETPDLNFVTPKPDDPARATPPPPGVVPDHIDLAPGSEDVPFTYHPRPDK